MHTPAWQLSVCVHALPSLQVVPSVFAAGAGQPVSGTQVPAVWHWSAVHVTAVPPLHTPEWHCSPVVHALLSLQFVPSGLFMGAGQPVTGTQVPAV